MSNCGTNTDVSFNPRPRKEATVLQGTTSDVDAVSIHAPVRRRRQQELIKANACLVSIHAPVRRRLRSVTTDVNAIAVSIHAPVRRRPWLL